MRILLDTNELLRALMRPPNLATFVMAWQENRFQVVASPELLDEYDYVLAEPAISALIYPESLRALQSHLVHTIEKIDTPIIPQICRDPDDDKVIAAAVSGQVDYLLTQDGDLLTSEVIAMLTYHGIQVTTLDNLIRLLDSTA